jgi:hypothetical protein
MRTAIQIQTEMEENRHQRFIAISKCNVLAAEHHRQEILRLTEELNQKKNGYFRNRIADYIGVGI